MARKQQASCGLPFTQGRRGCNEAGAKHALLKPIQSSETDTQTQNSDTDTDTDTRHRDLPEHQVHPPTYPQTQPPSPPPPPKRMQTTYSIFFPAATTTREQPTWPRPSRLEVPCPPANSPRFGALLRVSVATRLRPSAGKSPNV